MELVAVVMPVSEEEGWPTLHSRRFGTLEVRPDKLRHFAEGLVGFESLHRFLCVEPEALQPLAFLVACEDPEIAFPVLPAHLCLSGYAPEIPVEALATIGLDDPHGAEMLAICSVAQDTLTLHANLRGPILVNPANGQGCQVVLRESAYSLRHLLGD
jgi:flagellar assembly factor FliW